MAWVVAPKEVINRLVQAKQGTDLQCSTFDQMVTYEVGRGGFIDRHVQRIREVYGHRRNVMLAALEKAFPEPSVGVRWTRPQGGLFLWVTLPDWMDTAELLKEAVKEKVAFVPGSPFFPGGGGHNTMRLNFSNASDEQIEEGIARLGRVVMRRIEARQGTDEAVMKSRVAALRVEPSTVLDSTVRLCELAGMRDALSPQRADHPQGQHLLALPVPGRQHDAVAAGGHHPALRGAGYRDLELRPEQDRRHRRVQGRGPEPLRPDPVKRYDVPILYNFKDEDMKWIRYQPKAQMHVLPKIFPEGIHIPDYFSGKNIVHLPTVKCHIYTTTTGAMKNAFGGLLTHHRHYTHSWIHRTLVDLLAIQKEIHPGIFAVMDGTTAGNGPGPAHDVPGRSRT